MEQFEQLGISPELLRALKKIGFHTPTPIQSAVIPVLLSSVENIIAKAQTGTGKTAAFGLPVIQQIDTSDPSVQALILSPTRELALQIASDLEDFSRYVKKLNIAVVYGGSSIDTQIRKLQKGAQIVVGTPGRTLDLINRGNLDVRNIRFLVLDEADEMLNMGFKPELDAILANTPQTKQNLLFSATMPPAIRSIARKYFKNAREISVSDHRPAAENIEHHYYLVRESDRYATLKRIADYNPDIYGIVFCRTRRETQAIAEKLIKDGYGADALHGDLSQAQRDFVMQRFRNKQISLLVATDVAARGIDIDDLTHIINYNLPDDNEVYIHRSGRTARAGKNGISIAIITPMEASKIIAIERMAKIRFIEQQVPDANDIFRRKILWALSKLSETQASGETVENLLEEAEQMLGDISKQDLIRKIIATEIERLEQYYAKAKEIRQPEKPVYKTAKNNGKSVRFSRFKINAGQNDGLEKFQLIAFIGRLLRDRKIKIGKVKIGRRHSFFDIDSKYVGKAQRAFKYAKLDGQDVDITLIDE